MPKHSMVVIGVSAGGMAIVQNPNEALIPALPYNAIGKVAVDHVLPVGMIAEVIKEVTTQGDSTPTVLTNPDYGSVPWELENGL